MNRAAAPLGRLRRTEEFRRAYRDGRRATGAVVTVYAVENRSGTTRIGLQVSRRVGSAVRRNRVRRRLRAALQSVRGQLASGVDLVIVPRPAALSLEFAQVRRELVGALRAVRVLVSDTR